MTPPIKFTAPITRELIEACSPKAGAFAEFAERATGVTYTNLPGAVIVLSSALREELIAVETTARVVRELSPSEG